MTRTSSWVLTMMLLAGQAGADDGPSSEEKQALARLAQSIEGAVIYGHKGRIHKVTLGDPNPADLGPGRCARFSRDGKRIAVWDAGAVHVMNADGSDRKQLAGDAIHDGCSVEFHSNGREVIFARKKQGLFSVRIDDLSVKKLQAPGGYTAEPVISADGTRMAANWGNELYAIDLVKGTHRKYAKGCSPGVSPDGKWLMRNVGGHHKLRIESWDGDVGFELDAATCLPDKRWDNHHWSNHANFIAAQGDARGNFVYVMEVAENRGTRVTWERADSPDLFVKRVLRATAAAPASTPARTPGGPRPATAYQKWPGSEEGLVFVWKDATRPNEIRAGGRVARTYRTLARDAARYSRHHGMDLSGGAFLPEDIDGPLLEAVRKSGALTIELVVTPDPDARDRKGGKIVSFAGNFSLRDSREDLRFHLRTSDAPEHRDGEEEGETVLGSLAGGRPTHVVVSYRPGLLVYYAGGREIFRSQGLRGDLRAFSPGQLVFGASPRDKRPWRGTLDTVALYSRFLDAGEIAQKHALVRPRLEKRVSPAPIRARGRLLEMTAIPEPASIEPYRRALVAATYEITDGAQELRGKRVQVAHWGLLDGRTVGRTARMKSGDERALVLDPFDRHPQLESERIVNDAEAPDLPLFLDVAAVDRGELQPAAARGEVAGRR